MRQLSNFEKSTVQSSSIIPVNIVTALTLNHAPEPETVKKAFQLLQDRHPLLRAQIEQTKNKYHYAPAKSPEFEFNLISDYETDSWIAFAEQELMRPIDLGKGPLFFIHYLHSDKNEDECVLLGTFHHSIIDAAGVVNLLDELLLLCVALEENGEIPARLATKLSVTEAPENHFPEKIRGKKMQSPLLRFVGRQVAEEFRYQWQTLGKTKQTVSLNAVNKIIPLEFSKEQTTHLLQFSRQHQLTLNNLLNTTTLFVLWQKFMGGENIPLRTFTFADMRPYLDPPVSNEHTASHTSMMRHAIFANQGESILELAEKLKRETYQSFKRNEKFLFSVLSDRIMQGALMMKHMKMADSALSYLGHVPIQESYGKTQINNLHGFISTPPFGPILAAQAGILHGRLFMDFVYQDQDMSEETAQDYVQEIEKQLLAFL